MLVRRFIAVALLVVAFVGVAGATTAFGWELSKGTNGVIINREPTDATSTAVNVFIYTGYKGGTKWSSSYAPMVASSWNTETALGMLLPTGLSGDALEIELDSTSRLQAIVLSQSGIGQRWFAVVNEPQKVDVANVPTVNVTGSTTITGTVAVAGVPTVTVSNPNTLSVPATLGVTWADDAYVNLPAEYRLALVLVLFVGGVAVYFFTQRGH